MRERICSRTRPLVPILSPCRPAESDLDDNRLQAGETPPDTITLNNHSIDENKLPGALVGRFSTQDADTLDSHTYHFVSGEGDEDNGSFTLLGDLLLAAESFDYEEKTTYTIRVVSVAWPWAWPRSPR